HICEHYKPDDYLAAVLITRSADGKVVAVKHEYATAEALASDRRQAHFRAANAAGADLYLTVNALVPGWFRYTKNLSFVADTASSILQHTALISAAHYESVAPMRRFIQSYNSRLIRMTGNRSSPYPVAEAKPTLRSRPASARLAVGSEYPS